MIRIRKNGAFVTAQLAALQNVASMFSAVDDSTDTDAVKAIADGFVNDWPSIEGLSCDSCGRDFLTEEVELAREHVRFCGMGGARILAVAYWHVS